LRFKTPEHLRHYSIHPHRRHHQGHDCTSHTSPSLLPVVLAQQVTNAMTCGVGPAHQLNLPNTSLLQPSSANAIGASGTASLQATSVQPAQAPMVASAMPHMQAVPLPLEVLGQPQLRPPQLPASNAGGALQAQQPTRIHPFFGRGTMVGLPNRNVSSSAAVGAKRSAEATSQPAGNTKRGPKGPTGPKRCTRCSTEAGTAVIHSWAECKYNCSICCKHYKRRVPRGGSIDINGQTVSCTHGPPPA
jgi:hypothetical protein